MASTGISFAASSPSKTNSNKKKVFRRGKSLLGPLPDCSFGPKAITRPDFSRDYAFDPENHRLTWSRPPESVLIIKRTGSETDAAFKSISSWLVQEKNLKVYVEENLLSNETIKSSCDLEFIKLFSSFKPYKLQDDDCFKANVDLVITIGGDGTLLYAASLFQHSMPPVIAFSMGSLGFLTAHDVKNYEATIGKVLNGNSMLMLRSRLRCKIERYVSSWYHFILG